MKEKMIMKIDGGIHCIRDELKNNSVASGIVFYVPIEKKVLLDKFEETDDFNRRRVKHFKENVPHIILCNHYADMSLNIPGGKVEQNETLIEAVNREWSEEIMGITDYTLDGKPLFEESHFKFKKIDGYFKVYTFVRIIRSRSVYKKIIYDMHMASIGMIEPESDWNVTDSMGGVSTPIFLEPADHNKRFIGFPKLLQNVRYPHRISLVLCILNSQLLNSEERADLLSKWSIPRLDYVNFRIH